MFNRAIVRSTRFIKMPASSQNLYFHLCMEADDDGIVEAYPVMCTIGATEDDLKILAAKQFVTVLNEDLVTFIDDWLANNTIRQDRKIDSIYQGLLIQIKPDAKVKFNKCQPNDNQVTTKCRSNDGIDKIRLDKIRLDKSNVCQYLSDIYNSICLSLPKSETISDKTEGAIFNSLEYFGIETFEKVFKMAENNDFLKGKNNSCWTATFDWLINKNNMDKVLKGRYNKKSTSNINERDYDMDDLEEKLIENTMLEV